MKTKITLAMIMFIGFVLCSAVVAYYPMLIIRECPHGKAHVVQEETVSGNAIGATYWTDGKREAKMLPDHPLLVKQLQTSPRFPMPMLITPANCHF